MPKRVFMPFDYYFDDECIVLGELLIRLPVRYRHLRYTPFEQRIVDDPLSDTDGIEDYDAFITNDTPPPSYLYLPRRRKR